MGETKDFSTQIPDEILDNVTNQEYMNMIVNKYSHNLIIRVEPVNYEIRVVLYYYFDISKDDDLNISIKLLQVKCEIHSNSYILFDIFGIKEKDDNLCVICKIEKKNTFSVPCRHYTMCDTCSKQYIEKNFLKDCPICRDMIEGFITLKNN